MNARPHYQLNICRGDFRRVCERFLEWKHEPLVYRPGHTMFEGRDAVHLLSKRRYEDAEQARKALQNACRPDDSYALAAEVGDGENDMWIVMAAYTE
ncbi:hypothetical protein [Paraburkholderia sacchari]|uniref:hypothetical protein n=1 Tax=Paraburkholderia sacchari TaxID=159450 RepID=UPI0005432826|nr:hypothetical protein [Paraburkholderia sacchari]NLP60307.1 hypothetical protein [Paraburkholderia sacchari]